MSEMDSEEKSGKASPEKSQDPDDTPAETRQRTKEIGGRGGLDPTRFGDWEKSGRCIDF